MHLGTEIGGSIIKPVLQIRPMYLGNPAALEVVRSQTLGEMRPQSALRTIANVRHVLVWMLLVAVGDAFCLLQLNFN